MSFWHTFLDLILPRHCLACGEELNSSERDLCNVCLFSAEYITWNSATDNPFLRTIWNNHDVEAAGSSFYYSPEAKIHNVFIAIKYQGYAQLGKKLAYLSFPYWNSLGLGKGAEYIIPVPLSKRRKIKRGYNQAEWIAQGISLQTGIPVNCNILKRIRNNPSQTHKTGNERKENTANIFKIKDNCIDLNDKTILLVDDIMTTGATLCDCIRALREYFPNIKIQLYTLGFTKQN